MTTKREQRAALRGRTRLLWETRQAYREMGVEPPEDERLLEIIGKCWAEGEERERKEQECP